MIWMMLKTTGLDHSLELCFLWYNLLFHPCLMLMHTQQLHHGRIILFPAWNHAEEIVWYSIYTAVFQGHGKRLFLTKWKCICKSFLSNISEKPKYFYIINIMLLNLIHFYLFLACYSPFFEYFTGTTCKRNQLADFFLLPQAWSSRN